MRVRPRRALIAISATTGTDAPSAISVHGRERTRSLAVTMPAASTPTANSTARSGVNLIRASFRSGTCGASTPPVTTIEATTNDHGDGAHPAGEQQEQRQQDVQLHLDRDRPERTVGRAGRDDVLPEQPVDDDRRAVRPLPPGLREDEPRHQQAERERGPVGRQDPPRAPPAEAGERIESPPRTRRAESEREPGQHDEHVHREPPVAEHRGPQRARGRPGSRARRAGRCGTRRRTARPGRGSRRAPRCGSAREAGPARSDDLGRPGMSRCGATASGTRSAGRGFSSTCAGGAVADRMCTR